MVRGKDDFVSVLDQFFAVAVDIEVAAAGALVVRQVAVFGAGSLRSVMELHHVAGRDHKIRVGNLVHAVFVGEFRLAYGAIPVFRGAGLGAGGGGNGVVMDEGMAAVRPCGQVAGDQGVGIIRSEARAAKVAFQIRAGAGMQAVRARNGVVCGNIRQILKIVLRTDHAHGDLAVRNALHRDIRAFVIAVVKKHVGAESVCGHAAPVAALIHAAVTDVAERRFHVALYGVDPDTGEIRGAVLLNNDLAVGAS